MWINLASVCARAHEVKYMKNNYNHMINGIIRICVT